MAASKLSQLFNRGKKQPKLRNQSSQGVDSSDDEGYQDPIQNCPTEPPTRIPIPSYPPPRPASPKNPVANRDDYADPWDSKGSRTMSSGGGGAIPPPRSMDTYQDPFDSRKENVKSYDPSGMSSSREDYADPFDTKFNNEKTKAQQKQAPTHSVPDEEEADYDEPYEQKPSLNDTYEDPWDTRRSIDLTESFTASTKPKPVPPPASQNIKINNKSPRRDDYSDPWDSKLSASLTTEESYDDTYSEPYDKGKTTIMDEKSKKKPSTSTKDDDDDDDDIYDMPYEEKEMIGIAKPQQNQGIQNFRSASVSSTKPEPQRVAPKPPLPYSGTVTSPTVPPPSQPQQPTTSPQQPAPGGGDYDSPWEWRVPKVEQEFKRFSIGGADKKPAAPVAAPRGGPAGKRPGAAPPPPINQNINPVPKPQRTNPPPKPPQPTNITEKEYEVDPTIPLENQGWFHGHIRRGEAESLLHNQPDCSYLIRNSESSKLDFSLSLRNRGAPMHLKISNRDGKYILGINSRPYDTIPEMIHHYAMHMLNIKGAEHVKLKYPVFQENMYFTVEPGS